MKITTINDELLQAEDRLNELMNTSDTKFSPKTTYTIMKNKTAISQALKPFKEAREKINKKYSDDGIRVTLSQKDPRFSEWLLELDELAKIDVEVDIRLLHLKDLGDEDISPKEMAALEIMLAEEDEKEEEVKEA